jgi:hypothetical protein
MVHHELLGLTLRNHYNALKCSPNALESGYRGLSVGFEQKEKTSALRAARCKPRPRLREGTSAWFGSRANSVLISLTILVAVAVLLAEVLRVRIAIENRSLDYISNLAISTQRWIEDGALMETLEFAPMSTLAFGGTQQVGESKVGERLGQVPGGLNTVAKLLVQPADIARGQEQRSAGWGVFETQIVDLLQTRKGNIAPITGWRLLREKLFLRLLFLQDSFLTGNTTGVLG